MSSAPPGTSSQESWTLIAVIVGWLLTASGWVWDKLSRSVARRALASQADAAHATRLDDHERRIRELEHARQDLAEVKRDVHWMRKRMEREQQ